MIAHLVAHHNGGRSDPGRARAYAELRGHYAFVAMSADKPGVLVGARKECPLIIGRGDGEQFSARRFRRSCATHAASSTSSDDEIVVLAPTGSSS